MKRRIVRRRVVTLSGETLDRIFEHVSATGEPLLRDWRESDDTCVEAWRQDDGSYELIDPELNDFLNSCETWEQFADHCDRTVWSIARLLTRRGYPWGVPSAGDDPDDWPAIDAFEAASYVGDALPISQVERLRKLVPRTVRWDRRSKYPEIPRAVEVALEWLGGDGAVTVHDECWEMRGGSPERFTEVPSAMALSCLQVVLDEVGAGICLSVVAW